MENPYKWMIWGYPYFRKHPYLPRGIRVGFSGSFARIQLEPKKTLWIRG